MQRENFCILVNFIFSNPAYRKELIVETPEKVFVAQDGDKVEMPYNNFKSAIQNGKIDGNTLCWIKGRGEWGKVQEVFPDLPELRNDTPPPLQTPSKVAQSTPPPLPKSVSGGLWQMKVAMGATIVFVICFFALGTTIHKALFVLANPPSIDQAFGSGGSAYDMDSNGDGLIGFTIGSFLVSVIFSIWLLGKNDRVEKWKPIAMLAADVAAIVLTALINAS